MRSRSEGGGIRTDAKSGRRYPQVLATERLRMRAFTDEDLCDLHMLYGRAEVMAIRRIGVQDRDGSRRELAGLTGHWAVHGFGMWHVSLSADGRFIGECGLRVREDNPEDVEISYGLLPEFWGGGLATEGAKAAISAGFEILGLARLIAISRASNLASHAVLHKCGFRQTAITEGSNGAILRFEMTAAGHLAKSSAAV